MELQNLENINFAKIKSHTNIEFKYTLIFFLFFFLFNRIFIIISRKYNIFYHIYNIPKYQNIIYK